MVEATYRGVIMVDDFHTLSHLVKGTGITTQIGGLNQFSAFSPIRLLAKLTGESSERGFPWLDYHSSKIGDVDLGDLASLSFYLLVKQEDTLLLFVIRDL